MCVISGGDSGEDVFGPYADPGGDDPRDRADCSGPAVPTGGLLLYQETVSMMPALGIGTFDRISGIFRVGKFWWKWRLEGVLNFHRVLINFAFSRTLNEDV